MINPDELDITKPQTKPRDLQQMSIEDLENYITALEAEIIRADDMINKKQAHKDGIDALFGKQDG